MNKWIYFLYAGLWTTGYLWSTTPQQTVSLSLTVSPTNTLSISCNCVGFPNTTPDSSVIKICANSNVNISAYSNSATGHYVTLSLDNALSQNNYVLKGQTYGNSIPLVLSLANDIHGNPLPQPNAIDPSNHPVVILDSGQGNNNNGNYSTLCNAIAAHADMTGISTNTTADTYTANITLTHAEY